MAKDHARCRASDLWPLACRSSRTPPPTGHSVARGGAMGPRCRARRSACGQPSPRCRPEMCSARPVECSGLAATWLNSAGGLRGPQVKDQLLHNTWSWGALQDRVRVVLTEDFLRLLSHARHQVPPPGTSVTPKQGGNQTVSPGWTRVSSIGDRPRRREGPPHIWPVSVRVGRPAKAKSNPASGTRREPIPRCPNQSGSSGLGRGQHQGRSSASPLRAPVRNSRRSG